ncbi:MAG: tRNA lysidine(34) synthetase TilS [Thalassobaculum sp.]|uniref:tRNA lysidine(34) synthetase TilS n=1 Tax=Thalassobaculum sp. TaxID=2022740 RepID=UPI0032EAD889
MRALIATVSSVDHVPVDPAGFAARLDPLAAAVDAPLAVAVSGGPDSLALLHLADLWARRHGRDLLVYTVDHGLRAGAADEAAAVARHAARRQRRHRTLAWTGAKPDSGLQAAAREARYRLLVDACRRDGAGALLLAHHLDDQAETLLHRIDRETGPDGLAGMAPSRTVDGVLLLRPLLDVPKARLLATCRAAGIVWAEDPSNSDPRFARAGLRELAPALAEAGVTPARLGRLAVAMAAARAGFDRFAAEWMAAHGEVRATGAVSLDLAALAAAPAMLRDRLVDRALRAVGGLGYPVRGDRLARLTDWIAVGTPGPRARTLAGCRIEIDGGAGLLTVLRDWRQAGRPVTVAAGGTARWDGRFEIENATARPVRVGVCGAEGWRRWRRTGPARPAAGDATIPHAVRLALPAVVDLDGGIALPHLVASAPAPSEWVGDAVRVRFRPSGLVFVLGRRGGIGGDFRPSLPCNGRQAT